MTVAALSRIPLTQWGALVFLRTSQGNQGNAAILRSYVGVELADLVDLQEQQLVTAHGPRGRDVHLREATFLPGITIRLTGKGMQVGAEVVRVAVLLRWLQRIGRRGATLRQVAAHHGSFDLPKLRELEELGFVEATFDEQPGRTVPLGDVTRMGDAVRLRVTTLGKRYTAD